MKKSIIIVFAILLSFFFDGVGGSLYAQMELDLQRLATSKKDTQAYRLARKSQHLDNDGSVVVIAQMKPEQTLPHQSLLDMGVKVRSDYGRVAVLSVPVNRLTAVSELQEIEYLGTDHKCRVMNDSSRVESQVDSLQNELLYRDMGLDQIYDGSGVLVGVVDCGIDFNHAAFRDEEGNTRIRLAHIYETGEGENPVNMDSVRHIYSTPEEIAQLTSDGGPMSHGSHTSCTAAGSPVTLTDGTVIQGMAPRAELLLSSMYSAEGETYNSYCMDAIYQQIQYAKQVGKPIVINNSYGETSVYNDGKDPFNAFEESVAGPGRIICVSAGNSNNGMECLEYTPVSDTDTLRTLLFDISDFYNKGVTAYVVSEDESPLEVKLECTNLMSDKPMPFKYFTLKDNTEISEEDALICGNESIHDNRYTVKIQLPEGYAVTKESPHFISVSVKGQVGKKIRIVYPEYSLSAFFMTGYKNGNGINSTGYHCESDSVISVGSYCSKTGGKLWNGGKVKASVSKRQPSNFSSYGKTVYSRNIPDVLAPGEYLLSAFNVYDKSRIDQQTGELKSNVYGYSEQFGRKSLYGWMRGTSMACPSAVGVIALWLQANPNLSVSDVRNIIKNTSVYPSETEGYPEEALGFGYLKAANGLRYIINPTDIQMPSVSLQESKTRSVSTYNLQGIPVTDNYRGIIIRDGKKQSR